VRPLIVAAPASGSGKTSVTLGLMSALRQQGLRVAPFKVGPDYIDPSHHAMVCNRPSRNLDGWMCGQDWVLQSFARGCRGADLAIIEGVMGLFDGAAGDSEVGSSAEIARWLDARILLVVDARAQARSAAALVKGFVDFDPRLEFAGVVFNRVASRNHADLLREAVASTPGLPPVLGCLPRDEQLGLPERHLGLVTADDLAASSTYRQLGQWVSEHLDLDSLLDGLTEADTPELLDLAETATAARVRLGVARDSAFCFYYPDNLELLEQAGAELVFFSPLAAAKLPPDLDGLYLGGGYPELNAGALASNSSLLGELKQAAEAGLPIYAECGGFMMLAESIAGQSMAGVFPGDARMLPRRKALGYRKVRLTCDSLLGPAGTVARGHEFHYSELELPESVKCSYQLSDRRGRELSAEGYCRGNVLGSYVHLHFGSNPQLAENFVRFCEQR
jgi:cobyrinic acid a,c-diamide synthase